MEQENTNACEKNVKKTKFWKLLLCIITTLYLILLAGFVVIRIYLVSLNASSEVLQTIDFGMLVIFITGIAFLIGNMVLYFSVRYIDIPVWRWMASGFKGEPKLPFPRLAWAKRSVRVEARSKMNKKQRACIWLGDICSFVGTILMLYGVVWRLILKIKGDLTVGHVSFILFFIGGFVFFAGICVSGLVYQRVLKTRPLLEIDNRDKEP